MRAGGRRRGRAFLDGCAARGGARAGLRRYDPGRFGCLALLGPVLALAFVLGFFVVLGFVGVRCPGGLLGGLLNALHHVLCALLQALCQAL